MTYGYCRVSTQTQNIDRQVRNILAAYPAAEIIKEYYTGTTFQGRDKMERLLRKVKPGDVIVFDSVSRMSRNADEGYSLYETLYSKGIELVFLKEPHINTETYKKAISSKITMTGDKVDYILEGVNRYLMALAKEQIRLAFIQAQKEVDDLRERTKEGMLTAKLNGKQIGQPKGKKFNVKKAVEAKRKIKQYSKDFSGTLNDKEVIQICGVSTKTYYKYKKEIKSESAA